MPIKIWWLWMALAAAFVIGEMFTAGFFLMWFGIGALAAGVLAFLGLGMAWQLGAFAIVSGVGLAASRKFAERITQKQPPGIGADRFIGSKGVVLEEIDNLKNTGSVRIDKEEWRAESAGDKVIAKDEVVKVIRMDGTHVVVEVIEGGK